MTVEFLLALLRLGLDERFDIMLKSSVLPGEPPAMSMVPLLSSDRRLLERPGDSDRVSSPSRPPVEPREKEPKYSRSRSARRLRLLEPKWAPVLLSDTG